MTFDQLHTSVMAAKTTLCKRLDDIAEHADEPLRTDLLTLSATLDEDVCSALNGFEPNSGELETYSTQP
jgi:hypothetical protein